MIADHKGGLPEGTRQVLSALKIDSRFSTNGGIDGGKEGGGDLYEGDPPQVGGCGKACHISRHTASQGHQKVASGKLFPGQKFQDIDVDCGVL